MVNDPSRAVSLPHLAPLTTSVEAAVVTDVDRLREAIIEAATAALRSQRLVVLLNFWKPLAGAPLIPFHFAVRWPSECDALPLDATFSYYPHSPLDAAWLDLPLYDPADALAARQAARVKRVQIKPQTTLARADWEQAAGAFRRTRWRRLLAGYCFACIQRIQKDGTLNSESRPVLGRHSTRGAFKPCVKVLAPSRITPQSLKAFVASDLLVIDGQSQRGYRASTRLREVLDASTETAAVFIASSPADLYRARQKKAAAFITVGTAPELRDVSVVVVSDDRGIAEKEFAFASEGLDADAPLTIAAKSAWWALRQSVGDDYGFELQRFDELYSQLAAHDPAKALGYSGVNSLLHRTAAAASVERRARAVSTVFASSARCGTLVVTRNAQAREALAGVLARELSVSLDELDELGVHVVTRQPTFLPSADVAIVTGFFGPDTFEVPLNARVKSVILVVDEIEARAALWLSNTLSQICLEQKVVVPALETLKDGIRPFVSGEGEDFGFNLQPLTPEAHANATGSAMNPHFVTLVFADDTVRRVARNARFDLFRGRLRITTVRAHELRAGDVVVLLDHDSHAALSDQLLARLDQGILHEHALKRKTWLDLVDASFRASGRSIATVARAMSEAGQAADAPTVRTWLIQTGDQDVSVPSSFEKTLALAGAIELDLPASIVRDFYDSIVLIRRRHRHAGRLLARAIRGAQVRRLDIVTVRKLEAEWGFDPKDLLKGARVAEVEEVYGV